MILAIDPGDKQSAFVLYNGERPVAFAKLANADLLEKLRLWDESGGPFAHAEGLAIEMIASYGMPVGREVFETCLWIGRFIEAANHPTTLVYRREVKLHLCGSVRAKDGNVRAALLDRYGGKSAAVGTKNSPGPLRGVSSDVWAALGVAVTYADTCGKSQATHSCEVVSV
jgi:hypothetical protein